MSHFIERPAQIEKLSTKYPFQKSFSYPFCLKKPILSADFLQKDPPPCILKGTSEISYSLNKMFATGTSHGHGQEPGVPGGEPAAAGPRDDGEHARFSPRERVYYEGGIWPQKSDIFFRHKGSSVF